MYHSCISKTIMTFCICKKTFSNI